MRLNCLGTVGYHPNATRQTSCYFLPESGILLDAGTGVFRLPSLLETDSLDILLSHAHLDHTVGLTFLHDVFFVRPVKQCRIWGERAKLDAIRTHLFSELIFPAELDAQWIAIDDQPEFAIRDTTISWRHQQHPGGSVAYRIAWQNPRKTLAYCSDTVGDLSRSATSWAKECDLLMHECYFRDSSQKWAKKTGHSWSSRVAKIAKSIRPKTLLITHINPIEASEDPAGLAIIREQTDANVILAEDEMVLEF